MEQALLPAIHRNSKPHRRMPEADFAMHDDRAPGRTEIQSGDLAEMNAQKASEKDAPPSKSQVKKQVLEIRNYRNFHKCVEEWADRNNKRECM